MTGGVYPVTRLLPSPRGGEELVGRSLGRRRVCLLGQGLLLTHSEHELRRLGKSPDRGHWGPGPGPQGQCQELGDRGLGWGDTGLGFSPGFATCWPWDHRQVVKRVGRRTSLSSAGQRRKVISMSARPASSPNQLPRPLATAQQSHPRPQGVFPGRQFLPNRVAVWD